jgi:hypothetical protein
MSMRKIQRFIGFHFIVIAGLDPAIQTDVAAGAAGCPDRIRVSQ